jgi:lipoprotein-releasing system permease protein
MMSFEWFVALRYLRSPHKPAVLRLVTVLAVIGIAAGVSTLVIALAVNTGFRETLQERLLGVTAHVNLIRSGTDGIRDHIDLARQLAKIDGVRAVTPAIYQTVLISGNGRARGIILKGIAPALELAASDTLRHLQSGNADFAPDPEGIEAVVLGKLLAEELRTKTGDYVTVTSPRGRLTPFGMLPQPRRFRVTGIFDSGFYDTDANWGFITLASGQALAGIGDVVNVLEFRITHLAEAERVAGAARSAAGQGYTTSTWMEQNRALFSALRLEKLVTAIFIGLITFVAGLNVLVVLTMTVTDKARDIAVLMSLGTQQEQVRNIFVWQGLLIGGMGTALGLLLGYAAAWVGDAGRLVRLDPQVYAIAYVPFHANLLDGVWIALAALGVSAAATLVPARAAARILPVEILRYE